MIGKIPATLILFLVHMLLLNPQKIEYDWLLASFVILIWIGFVGIIWEDELKSILKKIQK